MQTIDMPGVRGNSPLGFLTACGIITVASRHANEHGLVIPTLGWDASQGLRAWLTADFDHEELPRLLLNHFDSETSQSILSFRYPKKEKKGIKFVGGLTPPLGVLRQKLKFEIEIASRLNSQKLRMLGALFDETTTQAIPPNKIISESEFRERGIPFSGSIADATQQTSFDFTSRNAQFLEQVLALRKKIDAACVSDALFQEAETTGSEKTLGWVDAAQPPGAQYTLKDRSLAPALEVIAYMGLEMFPITGVNGITHTTACTGRRKKGKFIWPIWEGELTMETISSLLRSGMASPERRDVRSALGISAIFESSLTKAADGYAGVFSPAAAV